MVLFIGPENFTKELASSFHSLVTDRKIIVRRTISFGFHEVEIIYLFIVALLVQGFEFSAHLKL